MNELDVEAPERLADPSDQASKTEAIAIEEALKSRLRGLEKKPDDFDGTHCIVCGEAIPEGRLKTGAWRDLFCQEKFETLNSRYRHVG